jgi:hypothetical protein
MLLRSRGGAIEGKGSGGGGGEPCRNMAVSSCICQWYVLERNCTAIEQQRCWTAVMCVDPMNLAGLLWGEDIYFGVRMSHLTSWRAVRCTAASPLVSLQQVNTEM